MNRLSPRKSRSILSNDICKSSIYYILSNIINDLDDSITSNALKFADDTKVFRKITTGGDKQHLQIDLDKLVKWSENGRCYSILGNVNAYIQNTGTWL